MNLTRLRHLAGLLLASASPLAVAADAAKAGSEGGGLAQAVFGLVVVLALIYAFFWLLRRYGPGQMAGQGLLKVVGGVMLSPRERLVIVEVGEEWLLLGVAANTVTLVHRMARPADARLQSADSTPMPFADKLAELLRRPGR